MAGILLKLTGSKAWQWIASLSGVVKAATIFITFASILIGASVSYNKNIIKKYEKEKSEIQQTQTVKEIKDYFGVVKDSLAVLSYEVRSLKPELRKTNEKIDAIDGTVSIVKSQLGNHIIKTSNDKKDILNWINAFEQKKNPSISMIQSPLDK